MDGLYYILDHREHEDDNMLVIFMNFTLYSLR